MMTGILSDALMITGFVFVMMLIVEYVNVVTRGSWQETMSRSGWGQYALAVILGASPGCLGAFTVVALFAHGHLSLGALTAAMIATSGDESFVMLAMFPRTALLVTGILAAAGLIFGKVTDIALHRAGIPLTPACDQLDLHEGEKCSCFPGAEVVRYWRDLTLARAALTGILLVLITAVVQGWIGGAEWNWVRVTILTGILVALFIVVTVPEHFLNEHLWRHVARRHTLRIFLWTFGALVITHFLTERLNLASIIESSRAIVLIIACLVGIIPESGPHLFFTTLFAQGLLPMSILVANSAVQDGHGSLPLLAHSRRIFFVVKGINLIAGLAVGLVLLMFGL